MTTTTFPEWHAEAMRLADEHANAEAAVKREADQGWFASRLEELKTTRDAARAALSAHLLAVPMGEPVAWSTGIQWPQKEHALSEQVVKLTRREQAVFGFSVPLFTKPEGIA